METILCHADVTYQAKVLVKLKQESLVVAFVIATGLPAGLGIGPLVAPVLAGVLAVDMLGGRTEGPRAVGEGQSYVSPSSLIERTTEWLGKVSLGHSSSQSPSTGTLVNHHFARVGTPA